MEAELFHESLEILVEEKSMEAFLNSVLPRILPDRWSLNNNCHIRPHEGKQDLQRSISKKIKGYGNYPGPVRLVIIHDQDRGDCKKLKEKLASLVKDHDKNIPLLIRIACRELENWYLGDFSAIEKIYPKIKASKYENKARFRKPDLLKGSQAMDELLSGKLQKIFCAREMGKHIDLEKNKSTSFGHFVTGIKKFVNG